MGSWDYVVDRVDAVAKRFEPLTGCELGAGPEALLVVEREVALRVGSVLVDPVTRRGGRLILFGLGPRAGTVKHPSVIAGESPAGALDGTDDGLVV